MIQERTLLNVADNSGAKLVMCIRILGGGNRKYAYINDVIKIAVKLALPKSKVKKGDVLKALVVRTKYKLFRKDGTYIRFDDNACILLSNTHERLIGTRILGPVTRELKVNKFSKIVSLAPEVL